MDEIESWTSYSATTHGRDLIITITVSERTDAELSPAHIMDMLDMVTRGINAQLTKGDLRG